MLTICIPIYNHDVRPLVSAICSQAAAVDGSIDVVCLDDGSLPSYKVLNSEVDSLCRYIELPQNVGRSRIRNSFLNYLSPECTHMLFMDCDLLVTDSQFVERYYKAMAAGEQVVVGGHVYPSECPSADCRLHYMNGVNRVSKSAEERNKHPHRSFMTGNFMIRRDFLERIPFDEQIVGYGHEDTLMGYRLLQQGIPILHIQNPLLAKDLDTNAEFLDKTRASIENLVLISQRLGDPEFDSQVTLLRYGRMANRLHLARIGRWAFRLMRRRMEARFMRGCGSTTEFLIYKLGFLFHEYALHS